MIEDVAMRPVIVIFGAAVRPDGRPSSALAGRVAAALALGRGLDRPLYLPTGGQGRYGAPEAVVMMTLLREAGVDASDIRIEPTGRNTIRSARACAVLLGRTQATIYVATSGYHMVRCVVLLRLCGLRARPGRAPDQAASGRWARRWFWRLRELPAVPVDVATMLIWRWRGDFGVNPAHIRLNTRSRSSN